MPFNRRLRAASKRRSKTALSGQRANRTKYTSGNWNPISEETMSLLKGKARPLSMIDAEIRYLEKDNEQLLKVKAALERRMTELRIEEVRLREILDRENTGDSTMTTSTTIDDSM